MAWGESLNQWKSGILLLQGLRGSRAGDDYFREGQGHSPPWFSEYGSTLL